MNWPNTWKMGGLKLTEDWKMASDNKDYVTVLSTDKGKAFDSLHAALMIQKLKAYGFNETSVNLLWSLSFLSVEETESNYKKRTAHGKNKCEGVRQAPPLGLYYGTCSKMIYHCTANLLICLYADDHQIHTAVIMIYRRPPKLSGDKQTQFHNGTRRTYRKPTLRNTRSGRTIDSQPSKKPPL